MQEIFEQNYYAHKFFEAYIFSILRNVQVCLKKIIIEYYSSILCYMDSIRVKNERQKSKIYKTNSDRVSTLIHVQRSFNLKHYTGSKIPTKD